MSFLQDILDLLQRFGAIPPPPLTWQPTYEPQQFIVETLPDGSSESIPVNITYFVTAETAEHLRAIYDPNGTIVSVPILSAGGPFSSVPVARALKFTDGTVIRAGDLAVVFSQQYPLDPVQADKVVRAILAARGEKT
jgi:hypothetical protein